jgi:predicted dehydrogenase
MAEKIRFGVIGLGHIGKRHAQILAAMPRVELVAICDPCLREADRLAFSTAQCFTEESEFWTMATDLEVVCIATPNGLHARQAKQALLAGCHVVIEKPMTLDSSSARELLDLAKALNKQIFPVMQNRFSPPAAWLKGLVDSAQLGELYMLQLNCFWNRDHRYYTPGSWHGQLALDGGSLFTQFSHFIDLLYWVFGDVHIQSSWLQNFSHGNSIDFEDSGTVVFGFGEKGQGVLQFSTAVWDRNQESSLTLVAEKGSLKIGGQYMDKVEYCHIQEYTLPDLPPTRPGNRYAGYSGSAQNHDLLLQNVVDCLDAREPALISAEDGLAVVAIIEKIYQLGRV